MSVLTLPEVAARLRVSHTTASLLANKGVPLHVIAEILGDHPLTARRYAHLLQSTLRTAMRKIG